MDANKKNQPYDAFTIKNEIAMSDDGMLKMSFEFEECGIEIRGYKSTDYITTWATHTNPAETRIFGESVSIDSAIAYFEDEAIEMDEENIKTFLP